MELALGSLFAQVVYECRLAITGRTAWGGDEQAVQIQVCDCSKTVRRTASILLPSDAILTAVLVIIMASIAAVHVTTLARRAEAIVRSERYFSSHDISGRLLLLTLNPIAAACGGSSA